MPPSVIGEALVRIRAITEGVEQDIVRPLDGAAKSAAASMTAAFAAANVAKFINDSIGAASNLQESMSKTSAVFGESAAAIHAWAEGAASDFGQSQQQAEENAASFGNMFTQMGIGVETASSMSTAMVELASDFASFHNADITDVLLAQQAAFRGEYDAVQRFVPTINAAAVEQRALADTGKEVASQLTAQERAMAAYALMTENAGEATGDFDRTSDSLANRQRILGAELENLRASIGTALLPAMELLTGTATAAVQVFSALPAPVQTGITVLGGLAAASVAVAKAIDVAREVMGTLAPIIDRVRTVTVAKTAADTAAAGAATANATAQIAATTAASSAATVMGGAAASAGTLAASETAGAAAGTAMAAGTTAAAGGVATLGAAIASAIPPLLAIAAAITVAKVAADAFGLSAQGLQVDIEEMAAASDAELVHAFEELGKGIGDSALQMDLFNEVLDQSPAQAQRLADALRAAGHDVTALDQAIRDKIQSEARAQIESENHAAAVTREADAMRGAGSAGSAAAGGIASAGSAAASAAQSALSAAFSFEAMQGRFEAAISSLGTVRTRVFGVSDAYRDFNEAIDGVNKAMRGGGGGGGGGAANHAQDLRKAEDAARRVTRAEEDLADAIEYRNAVMAGPTQADVTRAEIELRRAQRDSERAAYDLADAQEELNEVRSDRTPEEVARDTAEAELELSVANNAVETAIAEQKAATDALNAARASGDADAIAAAERDLADANRTVRSAQDEARTANENLSIAKGDGSGKSREQREAELALEEAQDRVTESTLGVDEASKALTETKSFGSAGSKELEAAERAVEDAQRALSDAQAAALEPLSSVTGGMASYNGELMTTEEALAEATEAGTDLVASLLEQKRPAEEVERALDLVEDQLRAIAGKSPEMQLAVDQAMDQMRTDVENAKGAWDDLLAVMIDIETQASELNSGFVPGVGPTGPGRHGGGLVGFDMPTMRRPLDGLASDEYVSVLQRGETVLTAGQFDFLRDALYAAGGTGGGTGTVINLAVTVQGAMPDARARKTGELVGASAATVLMSRRAAVEVRR